MSGLMSTLDPTVAVVIQTHSDPRRYATYLVHSQYSLTYRIGDGPVPSEGWESAWLGLVVAYAHCQRNPLQGSCPLHLFL